MAAFMALDHASAMTGTAVNLTCGAIDDQLIALPKLGV
jgi:hypothetical protein